MSAADKREVDKAHAMLDKFDIPRMRPRNDELGDLPLTLPARIRWLHDVLTGRA